MIILRFLSGNNWLKKKKKSAPEFGICGCVYMCVCVRTRARACAYVHTAPYAYV